MIVAEMIEWLKTQDQEAVVRVVCVSDADRYLYDEYRTDCHRGHHHIFEEIFDAREDEYSIIEEGNQMHSKYLLLGKNED